MKDIRISLLFLYTKNLDEKNNIQYECKTNKIIIQLQIRLEIALFSKLKYLIKILLLLSLGTSIMKILLIHWF